VIYKYYRPADTYHLTTESSEDAYGMYTASDHRISSLQLPGHSAELTPGVLLVVRRPMSISESRPIQHAGQWLLGRSKIARVASRKSASMVEKS
jgi:hypothetical protein